MSDTKKELVIVSVWPAYVHCVDIMSAMWQEHTEGGDVHLIGSIGPLTPTRRGLSDYIVSAAKQGYGALTIAPSPLLPALRPFNRKRDYGEMVTTKYNISLFNFPDISAAVTWDDNDRQRARLDAWQLGIDLGTPVRQTSDVADVRSGGAFTDNPFHDYFLVKPASAGNIREIAPEAGLRGTVQMVRNFQIAVNQ